VAEKREEKKKEKDRKKRKREEKRKGKKGEKTETSVGITRDQIKNKNAHFVIHGSESLMTLTTIGTVCTP
jgi:hypothetical protein